MAREPEKEKALHRCFENTHFYHPVSGDAVGQRSLTPFDREMDQMNQDFLGELPAGERKLLRHLLMGLAGWKQAPRATNVNSQFERR